MIEEMEVVRLSGSLGAEIRGISLAGCGPAQAEAIEALLIDHLVLFFPEQHLSPEEHVAFARHFGRLEGHPNLGNPFTDAPEIFELAASQGGIADEWHSDITFQPARTYRSITASRMPLLDSNGDSNNRLDSD